MAGEPFPKQRQLARGQRRYRRKVASPKLWQAIIAAKFGPSRVWPKLVLTVPCTACWREPNHEPCKLCAAWEWTASDASPQLQVVADYHDTQYHHVVSREDGGDDTYDNIVPLNQNAHDAVTRRDPVACLALVTTLTDAEYSYAVEKMGEGYFERAYGIEYAR